MSKVLSISFHFPNYYKKLKDAEKRLGLFIAAQIQTNRAELFQHSGAYNGHKMWKKPIFRNGKPLMNTGALKNSIGPAGVGTTPISSPDGIVRITWPKVEVGTSLMYAHLMSYGGIVKPISAQALAIPLPSGKKATPAAKDARSGSSGKKDLEKKIKGLSGDFRRASSIKERVKINNKMLKYKSALEKGPKNQRVIFAKKAVIPARAFHTLTKQDNREFAVALKNLVTAVLNGD